MAVEAHTAYEASKLARERDAEYDANHHRMTVAGLRFSSVCQGGSAATRNITPSTRMLSRGSPAPSPREKRPNSSATAARPAISPTSRTSRARLRARRDEELTGVYNVGTEEAYSVNEMLR
jgi:UDP-glucose 4-epimerase